MTVDMNTAVQIQNKVAQWSNEGRDIFDDGIASPYTEGFYDNCILFWEEAGYERDEVRETVDAAVKELESIYA